MRFLAMSLLVTSCALVPVNLNGQEGYPVQKGAAVLGGTVSFSSAGGDLYENSSGDRYNVLLLNPRALFFVADGLGIGGDVYVQRAAQGDDEVTTLGIGPSLAYFFGDADSSVYPFISAGVGYADVATSGLDGSGFAFSGALGAAFMLSRSVAITASGSYEIENISVDQFDDSASGNGVLLRLGIDAFIF